MLKPRSGFTLSEVMVALVLTGVIGAAVTGVFVSQSEFFDAQEKAGSARAVSRGAVNMLMSELRMVENGNGVVTANDSMLQLRVPYRMGVACFDNGTGVWVSFLPADPYATADATYAGYAYRDAAGAYTYMDGGTAPAPVGGGVAAQCAGQSMQVIGTEMRVHPTVDVPIGTPIFLYQLVTYRFRPSTAVPGMIGLFRQIGAGTVEELVAPFDTTAQFQYYVSDAATPTVAPDPAAYSTITGVHFTLDGRSERTPATGSARTVPFETSVFFRNRL